MIVRSTTQDGEPKTKEDARIPELFSYFEVITS